MVFFDAFKRGFERGVAVSNVGFSFEDLGLVIFPELSLKTRDVYVLQWLTKGGISHRKNCDLIIRKADLTINFGFGRSMDLT